ncbi:hypothetical protein SAMN05444408_101118 [Chryseobacterium takakiae]|uniref:Methionyl aminopeptidase n=1 Tax=Chryseobacterium takakiae TaxID=1302685 RepID=A0A1M4SYX2_9FLAO|nr:hypothetical protein SAMN05444408_101118 [Chryseobacterium takakiae]
MSITNESDLIGMKKISEAVAFTLKEMCGFAKPGMTTKEVDDSGLKFLKASVPDQPLLSPTGFRDVPV